MTLLALLYPYGPYHSSQYHSGLGMLCLAVPGYTRQARIRPSVPSDTHAARAGDAAGLAIGYLISVGRKISKYAYMLPSLCLNEMEALIRHRGVSYQIKIILHPGLGQSG